MGGGDWWHSPSLQLISLLLYYLWFFPPNYWLGRDSLPCLLVENEINICNLSLFFFLLFLVQYFLSGLVYIVVCVTKCDDLNECLKEKMETLA